MINNFTDQFKKKFKNLSLDLHGVRLPEIQVKDEDLKAHGLLEYKGDNYEILRQLCKIGYDKLGLSKCNNKKEYNERIKYELETLKELGFIDYILLVWQVINFCKKNNIPTGLGRGSAAGSIVLYLTGCTGIDPVKYNLYFERFVSKIRAKKKEVNGVTYLDGSLMCDVDIDVCYYDRHKVLEYLDKEFFGKTSKILTFNTLSGKLLMKEAGKVVANKEEQEMNRVSGMIPKVFGSVADIEDAYAEEDEFREWCDENSRVYNIALKLRNLVKNKGVHPSAIAISYDSLDKNCPTELSSDKNIVSSFDMNWISVFNVKLDILGLRGVSVVDRACKLIGITPNQIDINDPEIYQNLQDLRAFHGLFQIEADLASKVCQEVKPKNLEELSAVLALARPGAMKFTEQYSKFSNHGDYNPIHPFFDDILSQTGGVALYQEQLMQMAHKIGFTLDEAEILRRIVGKKKVEQVKEWKEKIQQKIKDNKLDPAIGDILWQILEDSANYSFNKSHSLAYAALSACTVYLKFKYPKEFFLALLRMTRHEPNPILEISKIHKELSKFNIELLQPHLNKSKMDFEIEGDNIRFGLLSIKGVSEKTMEKLANFKNEHANKFEAFESAKEAGLSIGIVAALIQAGALDGFKQSRAKIVYEAQLWNRLLDKEKKLCLTIGEQYDFDLVAAIKYFNTKLDDKGRKIIKDSRMETIRKRCEPYKAIYEQNRKSESFANWFYENNLLGYTYGKTLRSIFNSKTDGLLYSEQIIQMPQKSEIKMIGYIEEKPKIGTSRKGSKYLRFQLSDEVGSINVMIFNEALESSKEINGNKHPKEGDIVIIKGIKQDDNTVFASLYAIQNNKVYTKLSDLKN